MVSDWGSFSSDDHWTPTEFLLNDDVSVVRGTHQIAFGIGLTHGDVSGQPLGRARQHEFQWIDDRPGIGDFLLGK